MRVKSKSDKQSDNKPITRREIEMVIKRLPTKQQQKPQPDSFSLGFTRPSKKS